MAEVAVLTGTGTLAGTLTGLGRVICAIPGTGTLTGVAVPLVTPLPVPPRRQRRK